MAQADYSISNQGFPATRADINSHLEAIATNNSGTSAPSTQYAGQFWLDTTSSNWVLYIHDGADDIQFATIDTSANTVNFIDSELGDNSVTTAKIADGNVTSAKLSYPLTTFSSTGIDDNATSTAITIDSSERVGIGESSPDVPLHVTSADNSLAYFESTDANANIRFADGNSTGFPVGIGATGTSGNEMTLLTGGSDRVRIDSSGNVGIGTSSPSGTLEVRGSASDTSQLYISTSTKPNSRIGYIGLNKFGMDIYDGLQIRDVSASYATRFLIDSSGQQTLTGVVNSTLVEAYNDHASDPYGYNIDFRNASPDDNSNYFLNCQDSTTARARIESDGDLQNHDNSYGSISDERIKQDIRDSNSQWNDIKAVRVRNFKKKDDVRQYGENAWEQIGVIAQELETVSPKLIKHSDPTPSDILSDNSFGTLYQEGDEIPEGKNIGDVKEVHQQVKAVNYSVLYMKSIKALQEAIEKIETLEAKVQTLENNQS